MGCVTDTTSIVALRVSPLEDGVITSKHSVLSTLVVVQWSRSGDPVRDVRCDHRHLQTQKYFLGVAPSEHVISHFLACALTSTALYLRGIPFSAEILRPLTFTSFIRGIARVVLNYKRTSTVTLLCLFPSLFPVLCILLFSLFLLFF